MKLKKNFIILSFLTSILIILFVFNSKHSSYPNIVLITVDTLRADHLSCYGYKDNQTPQIDLLATEGVLFENTIAQAPVTLVSHASILTGLYQFHHGCRNNGHYLDKNVQTIAEILKRYSYKTGGFVSSAVLNSKTQIGQGFDTFDDNFISYVTPIKPEINDFFSISSSFERIAGQTNIRVFQWLDQVSKSKKPFFLWVHYWDPHAPYSPPIPYTKYSNDQIQQYDAEISYVDDSIGNLLEKISSIGNIENTILILTADHGENLGEHGYFAEHGLNLYEPVLRIPLILKYPSKLPNRTRIKSIARSIDIVPTLLELIGIKDKIEYDGESLIELIKSDNMKEKPIYFDTLWPPDEDWIGIRVGDWKYTISTKGRYELFNLKKDPYEIINYCNKKNENPDIFSDKLSYIPIGPNGKESYFNFPFIEKTRIKEAILLLKDIDVWGGGPIGTPTDVAIKINNEGWIYQNPRRRKLKDSPMSNEINIPVNYFNGGINRLIIKDDFSRFEAVAKNGYLYETIRLVYYDNKVLDIQVEGVINNIDNLIKLNEKDELLKSLEKILKGMMRSRRPGENIYDINEETRNILKSLGYIK